MTGRAGADWMRAGWAGSWIGWWGLGRRQKATVPSEAGFHCVSPASAAISLKAATSASVNRRPPAAADLFAHAASTWPGSRVPSLPWPRMSATTAATFSAWLRPLANARPLGLGMDDLEEEAAGGLVAPG